MFTGKRLCTLLCLFVLAGGTTAAAQTSGTIQGTVRDQDGVVPGVTVTLRNVETNTTRTLATDSVGAYRFLNLPVGNYELTAELTGFSKHVRSGVTLSLNQDAVVDVELRPAAISELVEVQADAPLLNTTNAEVGVRFDTKRVAELPVRASRDIFTLALSAPGVSQLGSGQSGFASAGTQLLVERHASPFEQHHDRRPGQQRSERHRAASSRSTTPTSSRKSG